MNFAISCRHQLAVLSVGSGCILAGVNAPVLADDAAWTQTTSGVYDWNDPANWTPNDTFPNGVGQVADIALDITGGHTIRLMQDITLGSLIIGDTDEDTAQGLAINAGTGATVGDLIFESAAPGGTATITVEGTIITSFTTHRLDAAVRLGGTSSLEVTNNGPQRLGFYGGLHLGDQDLVLAGDGGGSVIMGGDLTGNATVHKNNLGVFDVTSSTKSFTGTYVVNRGEMQLIGGSAANADGITINGFLTGGTDQHGGTVTVGSNSAFGAYPGQRLASGALTFNGGTLTHNGQRINAQGVADAGGEQVVQDDVAVLRFNSGFSLINISARDGTAGTMIAAATVERGAGATGWVRGVNVLGDTAKLMMGNGEDFLRGASGAAGSTTMSILPWFAARIGGAGQTNIEGFATYSDSTGVRVLETSEYATSITAGADHNARTSDSFTLTEDTTVNSLYLQGYNTPNIGEGMTLTIASGALLIQQNNRGLGQSGHANAGTLNFGAAEGVVWTVASNTNTIGARITGTGGLTKASTGTLILTGDNDYSGLTAVSSGTLQVGDGTFGSNLGSGDVLVALGALLDIRSEDAIDDTAILTLLQIEQLVGQVNLVAGINETIGGLILGDQTMAAGTYGSSTSAAMFQNDVFFTGDGILTVVPEPASLALLAIGGAAMLGGRRRSQ